MSVERKAASAAALFMRGKSLTTVANFYAQHANESSIEDEAQETKRVFPCAVFEAFGSQELTPGSGIFRLNLKCSVIANASRTTEADYNAMCAEVFEAFHADDLPANLSAADDFTCFALAGAASEDFQSDGILWETSKTIPVWCAPSDIAP